MPTLAPESVEATEETTSSKSSCGKGCSTEAMVETTPDYISPELDAEAKDKMQADIRIMQVMLVQVGRGACTCMRG